MNIQRLFYIVFSVVLHRGLGTVNFALHKSAVESTTLYFNNFYWTADKAVDGNSDGSNPDTSMTCSSTEHTSNVSVNHTWEVDIGFQIIVKTITVYGRSDGNADNLSGVKLFIGNVSMPWRYNQDIPSNSSTRTTYVFKPNHAIASVISLMRFNNILVICEVTVEGGCVTGKYGSNCNETCGNCLNGNNSCSIINGNCSMGCKAGWQGDDCKKGTVNFALHKSAVESTTLYFNNFYWTADKAVDGNSDGSNPDNSMTCSSTEHTSNVSVNHTWEVDIGFQIIVKTITVYGRSDGDADNLSGVKLFIGNVSMPWRYNQDIPSNSSSRTTYVFKPNHAIASVISLMRFNNILVICEVIVEGECLDGNFSEFCNLTCGKCYAGQPCNKENGTCPFWCDEGWKGTLCKEGCERGNYGYNCNEICGNCLYGNKSCSTSDGNCTKGCIAGWQGYRCYKECDAGTYGFTCNETCGYCLNGNNSCSNMKGQCSGGCQAGWTGETCKSGTLRTVNTDDDGPNTGVIVGSVLAALGVSIFAMVILIVIVKNRRKKDNNVMITDNVTTAPLYANLVVGNPDAACNITARSREERESAFSAIEEASPQRGMPIGTTNSHSDVMEPDVPVHNEYEKLRYVTESTESGYSTIDHNFIICSSHSPRVEIATCWKFTS